MFKIYVGNLSYQTSDSALREAFGQFGEVLDVFVGTDRETGRSRGFGFVTMGSREAGIAAIAGLNGKDLEGRSLVVNEAQPKAPRPHGDSGGGGGRGGYGGHRDSGSNRGGNQGPNRGPSSDRSAGGGFGSKSSFGGKGGRGDRGDDRPYKGDRKHRDDDAW